MRSYGTDTFILEINVGGSSKSLFQSIRTDKRRTSVISVTLKNRLGDINPPVCHIEFLHGTFTAEQPGKAFYSHRLTGHRVKHRERFLRHICKNIIPSVRNTAFGKEKFLLFHVKFG